MSCDKQGAASATVVVIAGLLTVVASGCGNTSAQTADDQSNLASIDASDYLLVEEPVGAVGVMIAREEAKNGDDIVLVGRIGGRKNPWIEGRSAFMLIDAAMTIVADGNESTVDQICLDDCCASQRADCTTLVKIVDDDGSPFAIDARKLTGAQTNDMVVVKGKVQRDDKEGTFSVVANGVYVRR